MSRKVREIKKNFKVFCEGDTEYHYADEMKRQKRLSIALKPVNMKGGGYRSFLESLKVDGNGNSSNVMLASLKRENCFVINKCQVNKSKFEINVQTTCYWEKLGQKGSNINEFFEIIDCF